MPARGVRFLWERRCEGRGRKGGVTETGPEKDLGDHCDPGSCWFEGVEL